MIMLGKNHVAKKKKEDLNNSNPLFFCRGEKTRTFDPLHPMQVR